MTASTRNRARLLRTIVAIAILALVTAGVWIVVGNGKGKQLSALFTAAVGVYPGSDVRVLGVAVGTIDAVIPEGQQVRVSMTLDPGVPVPADVGAVVVTPSLVSDRYVQLTPVYTGGAQVADGTVIPVARTAVPVELDSLLSSVDKLTTALGPSGANADGALSGLIKAGATNLAGNGEAFGDTIRQLGDAARTLSGSQGDFFSTVDNLQKFTTMLAASDDQVRQFNDLLAKVWGNLADERDDFGSAMTELAASLAKVQQFVQDNRAHLKSNVDKLAATTRLLAAQKDSLAEAMDTAPLALSNLMAAYDPVAGTIDSRANLNEFSANGVPLFALPLTGGGR